MTLDDDGYPEGPTLITATLQEVHDGALTIDEAIARLRHYNWKAQKPDTGDPMGPDRDLPTERYGTWDEVLMAQDDGILTKEDKVKLRDALAGGADRVIPPSIKHTY